jgi:hypothetical protein
VYGCPCEWSSEYASSGREAVLAWKIESGEFDGENLADLRLAAVLADDFTVSTATTAPRSTVFADSRAREAQRRAGLAWLRSEYRDILGVLGVHQLPIEFRMDADTATLQVGDVLDLRRAIVELDTQPWASLLYDPLTKLMSSTLGTMLTTQYSGPDLLMSWTRREAAITGYYGSFSRKLERPGAQR